MVILDMIPKTQAVKTKTVEKINETKSLFFENMNKIDKLFFIKKKKEMAQINNIRNEKRKLQLTLQKYKRS